MSFQTPRSIEEMLTAIHKREYLMPAIQREFVWGADQITKLVDSLMRGYPVGSFLLWDVKPETAQSYTFYEFLTNYHERDNPYADKATVPSGNGTTAVLDGQQRLTSLNIALYGSYAEKKKYAWWNSADAFPVKRLYLNLVDEPDDEELGTKYDLRFLADREAAPAEGEANKWFRVGAVLDLANAGPAIMRELEQRGIAGSADAFQRLYDLYEAVRVLKPMNYFLVTIRMPTRCWKSSYGSTAAEPPCRTPTCCCRWRRTSGKSWMPEKKSAPWCRRSTATQGASSPSRRMLC